MTASRIARGASLAGALALVATGCDWLQFGGDPLHSGFSPDTTVSAANVSGLHQAWQVSLPSYADGAPVIVEGAVTPTGARDLVIAATTAGDLLAYDAGAGGAPLWSAHHPAGACRVNSGSAACYTTSSPAVDPGLQYVYTYGLDGFVHKHVVGTGAEVTTEGWPVLASRKPYDEKGSSALTIHTPAGGASYLYVTNAGYPGDHGDYQGHVTAINLATGTPRYFDALCSSSAVLFGPPPGTAQLPDCSHVQSGVWARDGVVYDTATNRVYLSTGNGDYDPASHMWGDSVLAISPDGTGGATGDPLDAYTPTNYQALQSSDTDLGSTAPAVLPTPSTSRVAHLAVQGGKDAKLRLLNLDDLSGQGGPGHTGGEVGTVIDVPQGGEVLSAPSVWTNPADSTTWVFVTTTGGLSALGLTVDAAGNPSLVTMWQHSSPGTEGSPLVANGVVFVPSTGTLAAFDAISGVSLWSGAIGGVHWQSPALGARHLVVEDNSGHLTAFGL